MEGVITDFSTSSTILFRQERTYDVQANAIRTECTTYAEDGAVESSAVLLTHHDEAGNVSFEELTEFGPYRVFLQHFSDSFCYDSQGRVTEQTRINYLESGDIQRTTVTAYTRCYAEAEAHGAAVPVVPVVETVRQLLPEGSKTVSRDAYRLVQTPQTFRAPLLRRAYEQPFCEAFTDDASVVEALGHAVHLVEGNRENIKLTTPFDLIVARALVQSAG